MTQQSRKLSFSKIILTSGRHLRSSKALWPNVKNPQLCLTWCVIVLAIAFLLDSTIMVKSGLHRYLRSLRWTPLPFGVGFAVIGYQQYRHIKKREAHKLETLATCECHEDSLEIQFYKMLPLRIFSRMWGTVTGVPLPQWTRNTILGSYAKTFECNMNEAELEDLTQYKCLGELFRRRLKIGARPIDPTAGVVSPADGTVLSAGKLSCGVLEQVKGITYSAKKFLGSNSWTEVVGPTLAERNEEECFHVSCLENPRRNDLYQMTIYLAPGDYHRFHSPAKWQVLFRRHFPGELLSVNPSIASWIRELFVLNERVSYVGKYKHGFFSMTAVGATNVGSVVVPFDKDLKTNQKKWGQDQTFETFFDRKTPISFTKGDDFGEFNLGSTIVLIFEAPKTSVLTAKAGDKIRVGQAVMLDEAPVLRKG